MTTTVPITMRADPDIKAGFWYNICPLGGCSSTGQSDGFLNRRFRVRFPAAPPFPE